MSKPEFSRKDGDIKVYFTQRMPDGEIEIETMWCTPSGNNYELDNIPFIVKNISAGDIISVEFDEDEKVYHFEDFIDYSGNSTVRLAIADDTFRKTVSNQLINLGCETEGLPAKNILAVNIPKSVDYRSIKAFLDEGFDNGRWDYQESCLSDEHRSQLL